MCSSSRELKALDLLKPGGLCRVLIWSWSQKTWVQSQLCQFLFLALEPLNLLPLVCSLWPWKVSGLHGYLRPVGGGMCRVILYGHSWRADFPFCVVATFRSVEAFLVSPKESGKVKTWEKMVAMNRVLIDFTSTLCSKGCTEVCYSGQALGVDLGLSEWGCSIYHISSATFFTPCFSLSLC